VHLAYVAIVASAGNAEPSSAKVRNQADPVVQNGQSAGNG
jgi:hypothetical protein